MKHEELSYFISLVMPKDEDTIHRILNSNGVVLFSLWNGDDLKIQINLKKPSLTYKKLCKSLKEHYIKDYSKFEVKIIKEIL